MGDNFHSQLVSWGKIILPICGIALLSTLFLFARPNNESTDIPIVEIQTLAREQRLNTPQFSGVARDGSIIAIRAKSAQPDPVDPTSITASGITLNIDSTDGTQVKVSSGTGAFDGIAKIARLDGLARIETSSGFTMETNGILANLETGTLKSDGALEIRAPFGTLTAGQVVIENGRDDQGRQMYFTQGVRLVYTQGIEAAKDATK
jgi:lipopolysaccharide export system protein LptC